MTDYKNSSTVSKSTHEACCISQFHSEWLGLLLIEMIEVL